MNIDKTILALTLEEKASLCSGENKWKTQAINRLGIESRNMFDGPSGVRKPIDEDQFGINERCREATCFPTGSALAATWNRNLMAELGKALAAEAKSADASLLLGPGINMKRSPLGGRNFEYFSEDPFLTGELAAAYVNALQGCGVGACIKHFVCNNSEYERMSMSSEVDERTLREIYLAAFKRVIHHAQPWAVMAAYNKVNGEHATENKRILKEILRDEWGYENLVISDWGATNDRVKGLEASLDIEMPGPSIGNSQKIIDAVQSGLLAEEVLDGSLRRILRFHDSATVGESEEEVDYGEHHKLAEKLAGECMVLLKNEERILPLAQGGDEKILVIGALAEEPRIQGGGSSRVQAKFVESPIECMKKKASGKARISFEKGYDLETDMGNHKLISAAVEKAKAADKVIVFLGLDDLIESEGYDRADMKLPKNQIELMKKITRVNSNIVVLLQTGSAVVMHPWIDDVKGAVQVWLSGQAAGAAIANMLFGIVNPSGKLSETFPVCLEHNPAHVNYPGVDGKVNYREGIYVGYRYYDKKKMTVQYPFGHGLSYTSFQYSDLEVDAKTVKDWEGVTVSVTVENVGNQYGGEVLQLYVRDDISRLPRPEHELKGFQKVFLNSGEKKTVRFKLTQEDFAYFDPERGGWLVETGDFTILVGSSSRDIRLEKKIKVISTKDKAVKLSHNNLVKEWLGSDPGRERFWSVLAKYSLQERVRNALESENRDMVMGMPVKKVFYFEPKLAEHMDEIVKEMNI